MSFDLRTPQGYEPRTSLHPSTSLIDVILGSRFIVFELYIFVSILGGALPQRRPPRNLVINYIQECAKKKARGQRNEDKRNDKGE